MTRSGTFLNTLIWESCNKLMNSLISEFKDNLIQTSANELSVDEYSIYCLTL
jgi:hypothetical protein